MKALFYFSLLLLVSCGPHLAREVYTPLVPELPSAWVVILGEPHWRLEWLDKHGNWQLWEGAGRLPALDLMTKWASPVLAWPFWPEKGLNPGIMKPAGALFPWDVSGNCLNLSWQVGIDANFWKELALHSQLQTSSGTPRLPWLFDWPRFRQLFDDGIVNQEVIEDPWVVDWVSIGKKTLESGFDRRRIKAEPRTRLTIPFVDLPYPSGLWANSSPFVQPITLLPGQPLVLLTGERPEAWVSSVGLLRCSKGTWVFKAWPDI